MKRKITLRSLIVLALSLIIITLMAGCNKPGSPNNEPECEHRFGEWTITTSATCTTDGVRTKTCSDCGTTQTESIPGGHAWGEWSTTTPATCQSGGTETRTCALDATHTENRSIDALSHQFENYISNGDALCGTDGTKTAVCSREGCNETETVTDVGSATGIHKFTSYVSNNDATCLSYGTKTATCDNEGCQATETLLDQSSALADHDCETVTTPAGCATAGSTVYSCKNCEYTRIETIAAKGHSWDIPEATCSSGQSCTVDNCDASTPALSHIYEITETVQADCDTDGTSTHTCSGCGDSYTTIDEHATGHSVSEWTFVTETVLVGTTCDYEQTYSGYCSGCEKTVEKTEIAEGKHTYKTTIKAEATCSTPGTKLYTCTATGCTHSYEDDYEDADAHSWVAATSDSDEAVTTYTCACGESKTVVSAKNDTTTTIDNETIKSAGEVELKDASIALDTDTLGAISGNVTISADKLYVNDLTDIEISNELAEKIGTNPVFNFTLMDEDSYVSSFDGKVTVKIPYTLGENEDPECIAIWYIDDDGKVSEYKATYSGGYAVFETNHFSIYTVTRLTPAERCNLYGHVEKVTEVPVTCVTDGYSITTCQRCGKSERTKTADATGHDYDITSVSAGCLTNGNTHYDCKNCTYEYDVRIPAYGHIWEITEYVDSTCTSAGSVSYKCANCPDTYKNTIAQKKHTYEITVTPVTCTAHGYTSYRCSVCEYTFIDDYKSALGHNYVTETINATCTENGYTLHACSRCDNSYKTDVVLASHKWDIAAPTCGKAQTCTVCNASGKPATGKHTMVNGICDVCGQGCVHDFTVTVIDAGCDEDGYTLSVCGKCKVEKKSDFVSALGHDGDFECSRCGEMLVDKGYFTTMLRDFAALEFAIVLNDLTIDVENDTKVSADFAELFVGTDENGDIYGYGSGTGYIEQPQFGLVVTADISVIIENDTAYLSIHFDTNKNASITNVTDATLGFDEVSFNQPDMYIEIPLGEFVSEINGPDALLKDMVVLYRWYKSDLLPLLLDIIEENEDSLDGAIGDVMELLFNLKKRGNEYVLEFDYDALLKLNNRLYTESTESLYDALFGEGKWDSLYDDVTGFMEKPIGDVIDDIEAGGLKADDAVDLVYSLLEATGLDEEIGDMPTAAEVKETLAKDSFRKMLVYEVLEEMFDGFAYTSEEPEDVSEELEYYGSLTPWQFIYYISNGSFDETDEEHIEDIRHAKEDGVDYVIETLRDILSISMTTTAEGKILSIDVSLDITEDNEISEEMGVFSGELSFISNYNTAIDYSAVKAEIKEYFSKLNCDADKLKKAILSKSEIDGYDIDSIEVDGDVITIVLSRVHTYHNYSYTEEKYQYEELSRNIYSYTVTLDISECMRYAYEDCGNLENLVFTTGAYYTSYYENVTVKKDAATGKKLSETVNDGYEQYSHTTTYSLSFSYNTLTGKLEFTGRNSGGYDHHLYTEIESLGKPATGCNGIGERYYACADCGDSYIEYYINGHTKGTSKFEMEVEGGTCEDGVTVYHYCKICGELCDTEKLDRCDSSTIIAEEIDLSGYNTCDYHSIFLGKCPCGKSSQLYYANSDGYLSSVYEHISCYMCGLEIASVNSRYESGDNCTQKDTRTYEIRLYDDNGDYKVIKTLDITNEYESHNTREFVSLVEGAESCEDGCLVVIKCVDCGKVFDEYTDYYHTWGYTHYIDLEKYGANYGYAYKNGCACGWNGSSSLQFEGDMYHTELTTPDSNTISAYCYWTKDGDVLVIAYRSYGNKVGCIRTYYYDYYIGYNQEDGSYQDIITIVADTYNEHNTIGRGVLKNGATSCDDGVEVTYTCLDCGEITSEYTTYGHEPFLAETIDTATHGGICGGHISIYTCPCRMYSDVRRDTSNCDFGYVNEINRIDNYNFTEIYRCAVTDPTACEFAYALVYYTVDIPGETCLKEYYVKVLIGCDNNAENADKTITLRVGYVNDHTSFEYVINDVDTHPCLKHRAYTCQDCGYVNEGLSMYYYDHVYSETSVIVDDLTGNITTVEYDCEVCDNSTITITDENYNELYFKSVDYSVDYYGNAYFESTTRESEVHDGISRLKKEIYRAFEIRGGRNIEVSYRESKYLHYYEDGFAKAFYDYTGCEYDPATDCCAWLRFERDINSPVWMFRECGYTAVYSDWHTISSATCTQYGESYRECLTCGCIVERIIITPYQHSWDNYDEATGMYTCTVCGLMNKNGADGIIVLEDCSDMDEDSDTLIAGFWISNYSQEYQKNFGNEFLTNVTLILHEPDENGNDQIHVSGIEILVLEVDGNYVSFSKSAVEAAALELGYSADQYDIRLSFVPMGTSSDLDYGITFN